MRRISFLTALVFTAALLAGAALADDGLGVGDYYWEDGAGTIPYTYGGAPLLSSLTHNCPSTGKMLPAAFNPSVTTYLLTVASWVSRVQFTPVSSDPYATIYVNGSVVRSGSASNYVRMTDDPQQVLIDVVSGGQRTTYTIFLQRRPSERRTRVSAGYIENIYQKSGKWYIDADLVTLSYGVGNRSSFVNKTVDHYRYACTDSCIFYYGSMVSPIRACDIDEFLLHAGIGSLCRFIYIEDEIVAVMPYAADY